MKFLMNMLARALLVLLVVFALTGVVLAALPQVAPSTETNTTAAAYTPRKAGDILIGHAGAISNLVTTTITSAITNIFLDNTNITAAVTNSSTNVVFTNVVFQSIGTSTNDWKQISN